MECDERPESFKDNGNWFIDPEQGLPFEASMQIAFQRNPAIHERVKRVAAKLGLTVEDCVRQIMEAHKRHLESDAAERERYNARIDRQINPYGYDPLLTQKGR